MSKSLIEQLPDILKEGRRQAERILESIESRHRVSLQTREVVLPARDSKAQDWIAQQRRSSQREVFAPGQTSLIEGQQPTLAAADEQPWVNRLIYGDNLLAMAALLAGDEHTPSLRGKVDLIYIDPPFDSKADYRTKVTLPGVEIEQKPTVIEQFAYSDTWSDGTASYLAMITPRLILMRELLADTGSTSAPRDALDDVQLLLDQTADHILAATTEHLAEMAESVQTVIAQIAAEIVETLNLTQGLALLPEQTVEPIAVVASQPSVATTAHIVKAVNTPKRGDVNNATTSPALPTFSEDDWSVKVRSKLPWRWVQSLLPFIFVLRIGRKLWWKQWKSIKQWLAPTLVAHWLHNPLHRRTSAIPHANP